MDFNLREITKKRILDTIIRPIQPLNGWKVLVVDKVTLRIISAACRMYDIMEEGVTLVENISIKRQPLSSMEAIYFLDPCAESIKLLIEDFENLNPLQYEAIHLFFTRHVPTSELESIKKSNVVKFIKTFKEINLDFLAYESQVFHLDAPISTFTSLFSPDSKNSAEVHRDIAEKIVSLCATLKEYPIIRHSASLPVSASIARHVQSKIDNLMRTSLEFSETARISGNRAILLILDRSIDVLAPVLHEFTYQAMVYDLLPIKNDIYKYDTTTIGGELKSKEVNLSEADPLWPTLRHMHIADTIEWILEKFEEFVNENKASKLYSGAKKVSSLAEMSEAMKAMPQYQEMLGKYSLHINMANECMKVFHQRNLAKVAGLEQDMATGEEVDGKPVKNILSNLPPLLQTTHIKEDKIRLLITYIVSQEGIKDSDRKRLMEFASISVDEESCIANLKYLGVTLSKPPQVKTKQKIKEKKKKKNEEDTPPYELSRYVPTLKKILEDLHNNNLSASDFPFVKEGDPSSSLTVPSNDNSSGNSLRSQPRWADKGKRKSSKPEKTSGPVAGPIIVFIVGGITCSEMKVAYELSQKLNREVIVGSTNILKPSNFIEGLCTLKKLETVSDQL